MPPPTEPPLPEPMWVDVRVKVTMTVRADVARLLYDNLRNPTGVVSSASDQPLDYQALNEQWLIDNGYRPDDRGSVFLWNQINERLDTFCSDMDGRLREAWTDVDIDFKWTSERQAELDGRLRG